ncbi:MAG TPA: HepT-like ribonuclease domain-containing protein [Gammaproteobacteria bacterium]|nr:HepT-like ribonuclease domain-containing protein [Gammaproteobacteria bacterium]
MQLEVRKYLHDIQRAAAALTEFTEDKKFSDYARENMLRAAVERQFEIIGEALAQLAKRDESLAARITGYRRIIAFRNIL